MPPAPAVRGLRGLPSFQGHLVQSRLANLREVIDADMRRYIALPVTAIVTMAIALVAAAHIGVPFRDVDGVLGRRVVLLVLAVGVFWAIDVVPRAGSRCGWRPRQLPSAIRSVVHERWTRRRTIAVVIGVVSFYVTYLAYRNIKSFLPLIGTTSVDGDLLQLDQWLAFGSVPSTVLHNVLGTGAAAHVLSSVYVLFLLLVPISVGFALIWSTDLAIGAWYVTALSLNWLLGALSYYILPSLGPAFIAPHLFSDLPRTGTGRLQDILLEDRLEFVAAPVTSGAVQSIAAFASLHVSIIFTAVLVASMLGLPRIVRVGLWSYLFLTMLATIYFGWHYLVDDVAGLVLGAVAVSAAGFLTQPHLPERVTASGAARIAWLPVPALGRRGPASGLTRMRNWRSSQPRS